jgi:hypothetical protein
VNAPTYDKSVTALLVVEGQPKRNPRLRLRNDRRDVARFEPLDDERVGVVALVSNHAVGREVFEQWLGLRYIVKLPHCERENCRAHRRPRGFSSSVRHATPHESETK